MSDKFKGKYRIPSARWAAWDYGWEGAYFITICTMDKANLFGRVVDGVMELSSLGIIADVLGNEIVHHAKNVVLDAFVVMPNHVHLVLVLNPLADGVAERDVAAAIVPFDAGSRLRNQGKRTVSSIVGGYKAAVTKHAHRLGLKCGWQTRFHDHVIRNDDSYTNIVHYIANNPANWMDDRFFMP